MFFNRRKLDSQLLKTLTESGIQAASKISVLVKIRPGVKLDIKGCKHYRNLDMVSMNLTPAEILALTRVRQVDYITGEIKITAMMDIAVGVVGAPYAWRQAKVAGKGVTAAIVDTGIYPHPDLSGRIVGFYDVVNKRTKPYDDHGHGTHVAGSVASSGRMSRGRYRGVAPEAKLVGVKVLDATGSGGTNNIIDGIDWVIANRKKYNIRVMVMSLGGQTSANHRFDPLSQAVARASNAGIATFVAAGNGGPGSRTIYTPGIAPSAITVGAMDDRGTGARRDDLMADLSSRGPTAAGIVKPDMVAPGVKITSLLAPGGTLYKRGNGKVVNHYYSTLTGTSSATPIVAGMGALLLQKYPHLTPKQIKAILQASSSPISGKKNVEGSGIPNMNKALEIAKRNFSKK